MSDVAIGTPTPVQARPPGNFRLLHRFRRWGYILLGLQLAVFLTWSAILYSRFCLTFDFGSYYQPWSLIAHGNLDPYDTFHSLRFWRGDSEFLIWVLAPLYWITHTGLALSWLQDIGTTAAEVVAFRWMCEMAGERCVKDKDAALLAGLGLLLLVANPWIWWTISGDVHMEPIVFAFVILLARDLARGNRRAWAWAVPVLAAGAPSATYVVGLGLGGILAGHRSRRLGAGVALLGIGYSLFIVLIHGDVAVSLPRDYGYLASPGGVTTLSALIAGVVTHPLRVLALLWSKRVDMLANLSPGGLIGLGMPVLLPLFVVVLLANALWPGGLFLAPDFQNLPLYMSVPIGTVAVLCWLIQRHRRAAFFLAVLTAAQAVGWAAVFGPVTPGQWMRVTSAAAGTLASVESRIPASAEVIASQGIVGRFSARAQVYPIMGPGLIPVHGTTWFVLAPDEGIELASPATIMALVGELAGPLNATLVAHANGVWAFRWTPPPGIRDVTVPSSSAPLPAWTTAGAAGQAVLAGPVSGWHVSAKGSAGYVADSLEWLVPPGRYVASVALSTAGPINVEVWDDNTSTLVARRTILATQGVEQIAIPADAPHAPNATAFPGWGPFRADFLQPPPGQRLEVRVWSPGGVAVNVYSADLTTASGAPVPANPIPNAT